MSKLIKDSASSISTALSNLIVVSERNPSGALYVTVMLLIVALGIAAIPR